MFRWIERWFENEPIGLVKTALYVCLFTIINCVWVFCAFLLLDYWGVIPSQTEEAISVPISDAPFLLMMLFFYALIEEVIFRVFPISVMSMDSKLARGFLAVIFIAVILVVAPIIVWARDIIILLAGPLFILSLVLRDRLKVILAIVLMSSVLFAFAHGPYWWHLAFQGVSGIIFSVCYLKCGGYNGWFIRKPLLASTFTHCLSNMIFFMSSPFFSKF